MVRPYKVSLSLFVFLQSPADAIRSSLCVFPGRNLWLLLAFHSICVSLLWLSCFIDAYRPVNRSGGDDRISGDFFCCFAHFILLYFSGSWAVNWYGAGQSMHSLEGQMVSVFICFLWFLLQNNWPTHQLISLALIKACRVWKVWMLTHLSDLLALCKYFWVILLFLKSKLQLTFSIDNILTSYYIVT